MVLHEIKGAFFSDKFWLPPNTTWEVFEGNNRPHIKDLWWGVPIGVLILIFRVFFERFIVIPIGRWYKVSEKKVYAPAKNPYLERAFHEHKKILPQQDVLKAWSKQTDMSIRQIERWWRARKSCGKNSEMQRLCESCFRSFMYFIMFGLGVYTIWGEPHVWDTTQVWTDFPRQDVNKWHLFYYVFEIGFYLSLIVSSGYDEKQKDFLGMMIHHVVSLAMFFISWLGNFVRVAVMTVVLHDCADPLLDAAKVAKYLKYKRLPDILFIIFTVLWILSRLVVLPLWTGRTSLLEGHAFIGASYPAYWLLFSLYLVLQILHFYWFTFISKVIYNYIILRQDLKDTRSDTEGSEEDEPVQNGKHMNGTHARNKMVTNNNHKKD